MTVSISGTNGITFPDGSLQAAAASPYVLKNRIINGDMRIDQRNAGASVANTTSTLYSVDRWNISGGAATKFTAQRSTVVPTGFTNSLLITSSSAYSIGASDYNYLMQGIEGFNVADLNWGTANAQSVTLSFWARSSLTGTFGGTIRNLISSATRSYPFTFTINSANTYEYKTITIPGDTSGSWATDNSNSLTVCFSFGTGSTFSGTSGAWASSNLVSSTGATSLVGTNGATFYITGVQLEVGTSATPFERRLYNQELANCQRYFNTTLFYVTTPGAPVQTFFPSEMRTTPTITGGGAGFGAANTSSKKLICGQTAAADQTLTFNAEL